MEEYVFYHGGAEPTFTLEQLDLLRPSQKQQNANTSYAGFYMYGEKDRDGAFRYSEQENSIKGTNTKGVERIVLDSNLRVYEMPPFSITRITQEQIRSLQEQGYDLISGKMMSKTEYVLLNKEKIKSMEFLPMNKRYDYHQFIPEYSNRVIEDYREKYDEQYDRIVNALESLDKMFVYFDSIKGNSNVETMYNIQKNINALINQYRNYIPNLYLKKQEEINVACKPLEQQFTQIKIEEEKQQEILHQNALKNGFNDDFLPSSVEGKKNNNDIKSVERYQEEVKQQQLLNQQYQQTLSQLNKMRSELLGLYCNNIHNEIVNKLLHQYTSVNNHRNSNSITTDQLDMLYEVVSQFDIAIEQKQNEIKSVSTQKNNFSFSDVSEEEQLRERITIQNEQIENYIQQFQPYMGVSKINNEISKVIDKNNEIKNNRKDNLIYLRFASSEQQKLISWLDNAMNIVNEKITQKQEENNRNLQETNNKIQTETTELYTSEEIHENLKSNPLLGSQMIQNNEQIKKQQSSRTLEQFENLRKQDMQQQINLRMQQLMQVLGKGNVYEQIEQELGTGGFKI